ncbi:hypothetical protein L4C36_23715, partial [Photobacterium japonica]|uniref:hypothetical protein n=1 Tax=Photobacterium japonica TaxID=2910235 RepID=UPI003D10D5E0
SHTELSPDNQYRAEIYYVNGFRRLLSFNRNVVEMNDAGYIEIYREKDGNLLDKSEVISLSGTGPSFWSDNPNSYQWGATWASIILE